MKLRHWLIGIAVGIIAFVIAVVGLLMFYYRPTFEWELVQVMFVGGFKAVVNELGGPLPS